MTQTNSQIREEWEKVYLKSEKDSLGGNLPYKVISSEESYDWWISKIDELLKSQREELVEKIKEYKNKECKESVIDGIKYGLINGEKICDDIISNLSTNKENK